jgi:hypothetical protein
MIRPTGQQRIEELESALADAIQHLRMYAHIPTTTDKADELEKILQGSPLKGPKRARVAENFTPQGNPVMRAELLGDELVLTTRMPLLLEQRVLKQMRGEGYVMRLKLLQRDEPYTARERARIENDDVR